MTPARYRSTVAGLSSVARKVFDAVPIGEAWSSQQVCSEIRRQGKSVRDLHIVEGCLNTLTDSGLVTEPTRGMFRRHPEPVASPPVLVSNNPAPKEQSSMTAAAKTKASTEPNEASPGAAALARIAQHAHELRAAAKAMQENMNRVADALDDVALDIEHDLASAHEAAEKLRQLGTLLKGVV